eukprot:s838_g2.t4
MFGTSARDKNSRQVGVGGKGLARQDLRDTLQAVRSASVQMRGFLKGPISGTTESAKSTANMAPEVTQGLQRLRTLLSSEFQEEEEEEAPDYVGPMEGSDELHEAVPDQLHGRGSVLNPQDLHASLREGGDDFRLEEMFVQPDGRTDSAQALTAARPRPGSATSAETLATSDEPATVGEGEPPTRNAGTMTPPLFAVRGLLESEVVGRVDQAKFAAIHADMPLSRTETCASC